jgi:NADH-quinone oxidoreductase subunit J
VEILIFAIVALIAVICSFLVIVSRNPINSALSLIATMISLAILFLLLNAPFLATIQVIVYAGAIMVLFLFVIMLLNLSKDEFGLDRKRAQRLFAILFCFLLLIGITTVLSAGKFGSGTGESVSGIATPAGVEPLARLLFTKYLLPFELASVLLLVAIVGAIVMAKRRL